MTAAPEAPETGRITDEGVARLRARIGVPEPHTAPPHYRRAGTDAFRNVSAAYGGDNPLWAGPDYRGTTPWGRPIAPPPPGRRGTPIGAGRAPAGPAAPPPPLE